MHTLSLEHNCTFFLQEHIFAFSLLTSKGPHGTCNKESSRQWQLVLANPLNLSPRALHCLCNLFPESMLPTSSLLLPQWLYFKKGKGALSAAHLHLLWVYFLLCMLNKFPSVLEFLPLNSAFAEFKILELPLLTSMFYLLFSSYFFIFIKFIWVTSVNIII